MRGTRPNLSARVLHGRATALPLLRHKPQRRGIPTPPYGRGSVSGRSRHPRVTLQKHGRYNRGVVRSPSAKPLFAPNRYRGKLIVVEGIDGSGKSTQISLLSHWLRSCGYAVAFSEWNSSPLVKQATRRGKKKEMFTPTTFSLIHATDFADRMESYILPLVKSGAIVCADRYAYTAFARDVARGGGRRGGGNLYRFAIHPNLAFSFRVPLAAGP